MVVKRVLIGGGTGFIGQRLRNFFESMTRTYDVVNVSRRPGPKHISWTAVQAHGLPDHTNAVINLAGQQTMDFTKQWTAGFKQNVYNSRVFTTRTLAHAINKAPVKPDVFVVITGVGAYPPSEDFEYDENSCVAPNDFFSCLCVDWEKAACEMDQSNTRLVIIRSGVVLARWGGMIKNLFYPFYFGLGGPIGSGKQYLPWIHIDDLVRLIVFAIENKNVRGILNGVAPHVITNYEFTKSLASSMSRPCVVPVKKGFLEFVLHPERAAMLLTGQIVHPVRVQNYGFKFIYDNVDKACLEFAKSVTPALPKLDVTL